MKFTEKLHSRIRQTQSALCVGIDPRPQRENIAELSDWLHRLIEETSTHAAAYKPNIAYFEAMGLPGLALLEKLLDVIPAEIPVILDAKRGDIGETQKYYAQAYFEHMNVDAVTLNPFMGYDILEPFLHHADKAVYLLAVTSNAGAADIEQQQLADGRRVYQLVGDMVTRSQQEGSATEVGMVVGLTNASEQLFAELPAAPLLIPGLGAQGGELKGLAARHQASPVLINVSRGIMYQDADKSFADKAAFYAEQIRRAIEI